MAYKILVASYTDDISCLSFNPSDRSLRLESSTTVGFHPSWITFYPGDHSLVFAGLEQSDGRVVAVKYESDDTGALKTGKIVAEAKSEGDDPCSLLSTKDELFVANYSSGTVSIHPISPNPPYLLSPSSSSVLKFDFPTLVAGPNKERQERSHPHQVYLIPPEREHGQPSAAYEELLVPDLGADRLYRLKKGGDGKWAVNGHLQYAAGAGPRHVAYHNKDLFTLLELTNFVARHKFPSLPSSSSPSQAQPPTFVASVPTMSNPAPQPNDMLGAEILVPPTNGLFPVPYVYVSNRDDPSEEGDIISILSFSDEKPLELITETRTGLNHIRGIVIGGPDDRYLIAGGVNGGGVKIYERVDGGKKLEFVAGLDVAKPSGFLWV